MRGAMQIALFAFFALVPAAAEQLSSSIHSAVLLEDQLVYRSPSFMGIFNIIEQLPKDTKGQVVAHQKAEGNTYAVKMKITELPSGAKTTSKVGDEIWASYDFESPEVGFEDRNGEDIQDPLVSTEGASPDSDCANCLVQNSDPIKKEDTRSFVEIATELLKLESFDKENLWADAPEIARFSESDAVDTAITRAHSNKHSRSRRLCYRYVKFALGDLKMTGGNPAPAMTDLIERYPPGGYARNGIRDLKAQGWQNLLENSNYKDRIRSPADAPRGAVLVYKHRNPNKAGHIEIKTDHGPNSGYISDFYDDVPITKNTSSRVSRNYTLIGVMVKPIGGE